MTGIAEIMKRGGYATHFAGKWDAGMATPDHTPVGRGYDTTLHYFHHANDYYTFVADNCNGTPVVDLWNKYFGSSSANASVGKPAVNKVNGPDCTVKDQSPPGNQTCEYEDALFEARVRSVISSHDTSIPLFMFWATHIVHGPLQVPAAQLAHWESVIPDDTERATYHSMVNWIDGAIGRTVALLRERDMWSNTLWVFSSDNGGPISGGANNWPLRGGKFSNWEGGVRVAAFVSGGALPIARRGKVEAGIVTGCA